MSGLGSGNECVCVVSVTVKILLIDLVLSKNNKYNNAVKYDDDYSVSCVL